MERRFANTLAQTKSNSVGFNKTDRPGTLYDYAGGTVPDGTLLCDGSSKLVADYPDLFAVIGYTWGGAGANFNVPDIRGRAKIGSGQGSGLSNRTLAQAIGVENQAISTAQMPSHSHGGSVSFNGAHSHSITTDAWRNINEGDGNTIGLPLHGNNVLVSGGTVPGMGTNPSTNHNHGINAEGSGQAHNNMQPCTVVTAVIKY